MRDVEKAKLRLLGYDVIDFGRYGFLYVQSSELDVYILNVDKIKSELTKNTLGGNRFIEIVNLKKDEYENGDLIYTVWIKSKLNGIVYRLWSLQSENTRIAILDYDINSKLDNRIDDLEHRLNLLAVFSVELEEYKGIQLDFVGYKGHIIDGFLYLIGDASYKIGNYKLSECVKIDIRDLLGE